MSIAGSAPRLAAPLRRRSFRERWLRSGARSYKQHRSLLTRSLWSPLRNKQWRITDHQLRLILLLAAEGSWVETQTALAAQLGLSASTTNDVIRSLERGGIVSVHTKRGRHGRTEIRIRPEIADDVRNLRLQGDSNSKSESPALGGID